MMNAFFDPDNLMDHLTKAGVYVQLDDTGRLRLATPWPPDQPPEAVRPLLRELRTHRAEVVAYLAAQRDAVVFPRHDTTPGTAPAASVEAPPGGLDEAETRRRHDAILLKLAEDVPTGLVAWMRARRPKEWAQLENAYAEARVLILSGDYEVGLAAVEQWAAENRRLFEEFRRSRTLGEMPVDEAERLVVETFDAVPVSQIEKFDLAKKRVS